MELLLLEPLHSTAEEILQWANNPAAVHRYLDCLRRGWLGQAVRERYSFDNSASIPEGMLQTNSIQSDGTFVEWLEPIDDQIKEDLRGYISENDESIAVTRDAFIEGLQRTDDPGLDLLQELVEMMRVGLEVRSSMAFAMDALLTRLITRLCRRFSSQYWALRKWKPNLLLRSHGIMDSRMRLLD